MQGVQAPTALSVITGFLGSGKTTLLARLLTDVRMANAAVIINEMGEIGLDHLLVKRPQEDVVLLSNGCLCCTLRGDLVDTLTRLLVERARGEIPLFDRVLVETTGLADPVPVLMTALSDPELSPLLRLDSVITTVDAVNGYLQLDEHPECVKQVCAADLLLITKTDLADQRKVAGLKARLGRLNAGAPMHTVLNGDIDCDQLFSFSSEDAVTSAQRVARWVRTQGLDHATGQIGSQQEVQNSHIETNGVETFSVILEGAATPEGVQMWSQLLADVHGPNLLRVKGLLNIQGRPYVVQAVQHLFHPLTELPDWPTVDRRSHLVFITRNIAREDIQRTLTTLQLRLGGRRGQLLDPKAFRQFAEIARSFGAS